MKSNKWARITDNHWVNPDIGYIKCIGSNCWEIVPKTFLGEPRTFNTFEECIHLGEWLYEKENLKGAQKRS